MKNFKSIGLLFSCFVHVLVVGEVCGVTPEAMVEICRRCNTRLDGQCKTHFTETSGRTLQAKNMYFNSG
jgi:hypothetical protein